MYLVQLNLNVTCIFKVLRLGQFCENFENAREINPSGPCDYIYEGANGGT